MRSLQLSKPHLLIVIGAPGSGKSTFATKFSDMFHAPFIDGGSLSNAAIDHHAAIHLALLMLEEIQKTGQTMVYEPISGFKTERVEIAKAAVKNGYVPIVIWVQTDKLVCETRTTRKSRSNPHPMDAEEFERQYKRFTTPGDKEKYVVISGMHTYATQAKAVLRKLSEQIVRPAVAPRPLVKGAQQPRRPTTVQ